MIKKSLPEVRVTTPYAGYATIRGRDDLDPNSDAEDLKPSKHRIEVVESKSVTAIPENVGLCEVVETGRHVSCVKSGDVVFVDFFDVAQGYIVDKSEMYLCPAHAFRVRLDGKTPVPLPGYAITKHAPTRMTRAIAPGLAAKGGCLPRDMTTGGLVSARSASDGHPSSWVCYEEIVSVARGDMQISADEGHEVRVREHRIAELEAALRAVDPENTALRPMSEAEMVPGELAVFGRAFSLQFRCDGELYRVVPKRNLLATIDDGEIARRHPEATERRLIRLVGS